MKSFSQALFLVADNQTNNKGDVAGKYNHGVTIPYESELIGCVKSWRNHGGVVADIPIYVFCPTKDGISQKTQDTIEEYGCLYTHEHLPETDTFTCGYWNVPLAGKHMETVIKEDVIIHIDLDMLLIREPAVEELMPCQTTIAFVGVNEHRPTVLYPEFGGVRYPQEANTGFIVSWRRCWFYRDWYDRLTRGEEIGEFHKDDPEYSIWEERIVDRMRYDERYVIEYVDKFQVNGDVTDYTDDEVMNILFFHGHYNMKERNKENWKKYVRRYASARRNLSSK